MTLTDDDKLAVASAYAKACSAGDRQGILAICEPDAMVWHNYDDVDVPVNEIPVQWLFQVMPDVVWEEIALHVTPTGFVRQAVIAGTGPHGPVRAHICMVVTVSATGKVARTDEYLDPAALASLQDAPPDSPWSGTGDSS